MANDPPAVLVMVDRIVDALCSTVNRLHLQPTVLWCWSSISTVHLYGRSLRLTRQISSPPRRSPPPFSLCFYFIDVAVWKCSQFCRCMPVIPSSLERCLTSAIAPAGSVSPRWRSCHATHTSRACPIHLPGRTPSSFVSNQPSTRRLSDGASITSKSARWSKKHFQPVRNPETSAMVLATNLY